MKQNTTYIAMTAALVTASVAVSSDSSENQLWMDGSLSGKVSEKLTMKLSEQIRYKDEGNLYYYRYTDFAVGYGFAKNWSVVPAFRYISSANSQGVWSNKEMVHINLNHTLPLKVVDLKTRLRFTYTDQDSCQADFRPETTLLPSRGFTDWKLMPYLADEIMYNLNEEHLYKNRASIGLMCAPMKPLSLKVFVMQETTQKTEESDFNENFGYGLYAGCKF